MKKELWNNDWLFWNSKDAFSLIWNIPKDARKITLPHDAMLENPPHKDSLNKGNTGFYDGGSYTYVKKFKTKSNDRRKNYILRFDGIYMNAFVYVNGQLAANHPYGYSQFYVPISHLLKKEGTNEIRILVRNGAMPNGRWYTGSGIYRDVYLLTSENTYISEKGSKVIVEECDSTYATIKVFSSIINKDVESHEIEYSYQICDQNNQTVATNAGTIHMNRNSHTELSSRINIASPLLWSEYTPALYNIKLTLSENGKIIDISETRFGIRKLSLDAKQGLKINGKTVKLRGACIHHDNGLLGAKTFYDSEFRRIKLLKKSGFNAIRMSHHPASPALLDACDALGMYVMDEAFDMWTRPKSDYDYNLFFNDWWKKDIQSMINQDFNHPSVILYSIGNEIPEIGTNEGCHLASQISEFCHQLDNSRYTLSAINGVFAVGDSIEKITTDIAGEVSGQDDSVNVNDFMTIMDKYMDKIVVHPEITACLKKACATTDIAGYNYMTARYDMDVQSEPNRIIVGSETYPPEIATNWEKVSTHSQIIGDFTWTGWDYLGEAGVGIPGYSFGEGGFGAQYPARLAYTGDIDITGFRRPLSYYREIVFGLRKSPYIAVQSPKHYGQNLIKTPWVMSDAISSWTYNGYENQPIVVEVYTNGDKVELFLNNQLIDAKPVTRKDNCIVLFNTKYIPGELKAIAYLDDQPLGQYVLNTIEDDKIFASIDSSLPQNSELVYINITVGRDADFVNCNARCELSLIIDGDAELLGFGSANPKPFETYLENKTTTWNGRALAILKKAEKKSTIQILSDTGHKVILSI